MADAVKDGAGVPAGRIVQVRVDHELYEWLRAKSFYERRNMNALVGEALAEKRAVEAPHEVWRDDHQGQLGKGAR